MALETMSCLFEKTHTTKHTHLSRDHYDQIAYEIPKIELPFKSYSEQEDDQTIYFDYGPEYRVVKQNHAIDVLRKHIDIVPLTSTVLQQ